MVCFVMIRAVGNGVLTLLANANFETKWLLITADTIFLFHSVLNFQVWAQSLLATLF